MTEDHLATEAKRLEQRIRDRAKYLAGEGAYELRGAVSLYEGRDGAPRSPAAICLESAARDLCAGRWNYQVLEMVGGDADIVLIGRDR